MRSHCLAERGTHFASLFHFPLWFIHYIHFNSDNFRNTTSTEATIGVPSTTSLLAYHVVWYPRINSPPLLFAAVVPQALLGCAIFGVSFRPWMATKTLASYNQQVLNRLLFPGLTVCRVFPTYSRYFLQ